MLRSDFFQDVFTKCVPMTKFLDILGRELHCGHNNKISFYGVLPKNFTFAHNEFEVTKLCRTRSDGILKPTP